MLFLFIAFSFSNQQTVDSLNNIKRSHISEDCNYGLIFNNRISNINRLCFISCEFYSIYSSTMKGGAIYIEISSISNIIKNCTFKQCQGTEGGSLYIFCSSPFEININECLFENNEGSQGGSIFCKNSNITFLNCLFTKNQANGILYGRNYSSFGGGIYFSNCNISFEKCEFTHNSVYSYYNSTKLYSYGGGIYLYNCISTILTECDFVNNSAVSALNSDNCLSGGGGIYSSSSPTTFYQCNFNGNFANSTSHYYATASGGAFFISTSSQTTAFNCNFNNNHVYTYDKEPLSQGGAICIFRYNASFFNCIFNNNSATSHSTLSVPTSYGGAIVYNRDYLESFNCSFINNYALSIIFKNGCYCQGGSSHIGCKSASLCNCNYINNSAIARNSSSTYSGAIYLDTNNFILLDNCIFNNNTSLSYSTGSEYGFSYAGGVYIYISLSSNVTISNSVFNNHRVEVFTNSKSIQSYGSVFYITGFDSYHDYIVNLSIINCSFTNNTLKAISAVSSSCKGGVIYSYVRPNSRSSIDTSFSSCVFSNNSMIGSCLYSYESCFNGSILYLEVSNFTVDSCIFTDNYAEVKCEYNDNIEVSGVIYFTRYNLYLNSSIFCNNKFTSNQTRPIGGYGSAVAAVLPYSTYYNNCCCFIEECKFINNSFHSNIITDGCNFYFIATNLTIKDSEIENDQNDSSNLISFSFFDYVILDIENCTFKINVFNSSIQKSMITLSILVGSRFINNFKNNKVYVFNNIDYKIFSGTTNKNLSWHFENNCIMPYVSSIFIKNGLILYVENTSELIEFSEAFNAACILPSKEFTNSNVFTETSEFTKSNHFTFSVEFTESKIFTKSNEFSKTLQFTFSDEFSKSNDFSQSLQFTKSSGFDYSETILTILHSFYSSSSFLHELISTEFFESIRSLNSLQVSLSKSVLQIYSETFFDSFTECDSNCFQPDQQITSKNNSKGKTIGIICGILAAVLIITIVVVTMIFVKKHKKQNKESDRSLSTEEHTKKTNPLSNPPVNESEDEDMDFWL